MTESNPACGSVAKLFLYPVKSMQGEARESLEFDERGGVGDRLFAVKDAEGKLGSGKTTRRFRRLDGLLNCEASRAGEGVLVRLPDGTMLKSGDPTTDERLSEFFGRDVVLGREDAVSHFDAGAVHIVCAREIENLASLMPEARCVERRFRPNIVISRAGDVTLSDWVGKTVKLGDEVVLRITAKTERCRMVSIEQTGLRDAPEILRAIVEKHDLAFGVYAEVLHTGSVSVGDEVALQRP